MIPVQGTTYKMFCVRDDKVEGQPWNHIYPSRLQVRCCGHKDEEIKPIDVSISDSGSYWGWYDSNHKDVCMIWRERFLLEMCFTYGSKVEEDRGRGSVVRLHIAESNS